MSNKLTHGVWTPFDDVVAIARGYRDVTGVQVDNMLRVAADKGLIDGFKREWGNRPRFAPVIVRTCESVPATFLYGRDLARWMFGATYKEWDEAYAQGVDGHRVKLISGARTFVPDELALHIVDFGANWDRSNGVVVENVQQAQAEQLAVFDALFAASQHPEWVHQMNGLNIPYAIMAGLLLNMGPPSWRLSPGIWRSGEGVKLNVCHIAAPRLEDCTLPTLVEYPR